MDMDMDMATDTDTDMELANLRRNFPYSAIWNAAEISRRNFQWRFILVAPLQKENSDMKI